jgi:arylsulfatase
MKIRILVIGILIISYCQSCNTKNINNKIPFGKPNIIFIMADDMGYGEAGCYGQKIIQTPNIDKIAREGIKFTQFYSGQAVCAPARCSLLTGYHMGHSYIRNNGQPKERNPITPFPGQNPIPDSILTIGEILQQNGFVTAAIGKWGLGNTGTSGDPNHQGFDLFYGYKCQVHAHNHYPSFMWLNDKMEQIEGNDGKSLRGAHHSQDLFTKEALKFINENKDQPFFLYLPFIIPHLSIQTTDKFLDMYKDKIPETPYKHHGYLENPYPHAAYAGMITQMDDAIGQVMEEVKKLGLDKNTLIIFTSDNGPAYRRLGGSDDKFFNSAGGLRGLKGDLFEGGIREPMVASWPGKIKPGTVSGLPFAFWDVLPTLCEITGAKIPGNIDGISFLPALTGKGTQKVHENLYWEFKAYGGQAAMIKDDWKVVIRDLSSKKKEVSVMLFNLKNDKEEQHDLAKENPEKVKEILQEMKNARVPSELFNFPQLVEFYANI